MSKKTERQKANFRIAERLCGAFPGLDLDEAYKVLERILPLSIQEAEEEINRFYEETEEQQEQKPSVFGRLRTALHADGCGLKTVIEAAVAKVEEVKQLREENERLRKAIRAWYLGVHGHSAWNSCDCLLCQKLEAIAEDEE